MWSVARRNVYWQQAGVPIVRQEYTLITVWLALEREDKRCFTRSQTHQSVAELVVTKCAVLVTVRVPFAVEDKMVNENPVNPVRVLVEEPNLMILAKAPDSGFDFQIFGILVSLGSLAVVVAWSHHHHTVTTLGQSDWECTADISQTSRLRPWGSFRRNEDDVPESLGLIHWRVRTVVDQVGDGSCRHRCCHTVVLSHNRVLLQKCNLS
mmetsp:Transcript_11066/g.40527  ORF Transcript_11066/g.40527 Transcript_11066/m.40527 type:complete len:209 (-) Transcript_11066:605-1231(-)